MFSEAQPRASEGSTPELCVFIPTILVFLAKYQSLLAFIWVHVCFVQDFPPCFFHTKMDWLQHEKGIQYS